MSQKQLLKWLEENVTKTNLVKIILFAILIVLHSPLEETIAKLIVNPFLSKIESNLWTGIIFIGLAMILCVASFLHHKKKVLFSWPIFPMLALLAYIYYRCYAVTWTFIPFMEGAYFYFTDILVMVAIFDIIFAVLLPCFCNREKKTDSQTENIKTLFDDNPITKENKIIDSLGFKNYAKTLITKIQENDPFDRAFAIGINGKWGSGKSSFIGLMKRELESANIKNEIIEVNCNPWSSENPNAIIKDFFETLQEAIKPYHSKAAHKMLSYSSKLVAADESILGQLFHEGISLLTDDQSVGTLFEEIKKSIKKIGKKLVIFIDDVDRLDKKEIIEVIRLIRNTANFPNTFFVVAYDRDYVVAAIEDYNKHDTDRFLEKIFQVEVNLPYVDGMELRKQFANKLKQLLGDDNYNIEKLDDNIVDTPSTQILYFDGWIESMRDIARLINSLSLNLIPILGEVDVIDFIKLELLRQKYPSVHSLIPKLHLSLLIKKSDKELKYTGIERYILDYEGNKTDDVIEYNLNVYIKNNNLNVSVTEIEKILTLLDSIFFDNRGYWPAISISKRKDMSVAYPSHFKRYFRYYVSEHEFSEVEFEKALTGSFEELALAAEGWCDRNLEYETKKHLLDIEEFKNKEEFEKIIRILFRFGNKLSIFPHELYQKINESKKISEGYYNNNESEFADFIKYVFNSSNSPYLFEATFIQKIRNTSNVSFILQTQELKNILHKYLIDYTTLINTINDNVWYKLFNSCSVEDDEGKFIYTPESIEIIKKFINRIDFNEFIEFTIISTLHNRKSYMVDAYFLNIYDSWNDFEQMVQSKDETQWDKIAEFKEFYALFKGKGFNTYIPFDFKKIIVKRPS